MIAERWLDAIESAGFEYMSDHEGPDGYYGPAVSVGTREEADDVIASVPKDISSVVDPEGECFIVRPQEGWSVGEGIS